MRVRGPLARRRERAARRRTFQEIFTHRAWGDGESVSGPGSTLARTGAFRDALDDLLARQGVQSVVDIGCGDGNWIHLLRTPLVRYVGIDVVPELVTHNDARHRRPGREFLCLDAVVDPLPRADLVLCRDCLVHLTFDEIHRLIANIRRSGSTWLLATTFTDRTENVDIPTGLWRTLNMAIAPFDLGPPTAFLSEERLNDDDGAYADKGLGLWRLSAAG